ncbi:NADH:flavin oxidoreductase [Sphingomonas sp. SRS2]|uniref:NADH:flavin oxidoreductase n=1 Tax=Sphingomonas sp. SRS2 TaxID=133190 RepID=UPI00061842D3|nr:NADH:flavin oxidoreductase [Sphingomonas sp. SRS2]KKC25192.1 1,2-oxophytodienoate reductase [Sphingomonas sp. SRS2]
MNLLHALEQPFRYKSLHLKNRFVMSPMTRYSAPMGIPTDDVAAYYRRRAEGGVGLIITEGLGIDRTASRAISTVPNFYGEEPLGAWKRILDGVQLAGATMAPQFWHVGGVPDFNFPDEPPAALESPSGLIGPNVAGGRLMTEEDVADVISSYCRAAADARRLGFNAAEIHAAHGYLVDQFFWSETNRRNGRYGGATLRERARFGADIYRAMRSAVGDDFVLMMRISQWKTGFYNVRMASTPSELEGWLEPLVDAGVDIFDCSQRRFWEPEFEGSDLNFAGWVKKLTGQPTITVGSVGLDRDLFADVEQGGESHPHLASLRELSRRYERGDFDLVAMGRVLLADPEWLNKVRTDRCDELIPYSSKVLETLF